MKRLTYITIIIMVFSGCKKALEETPYSNMYTQNFYSNAAEAEAAISAVYGNLYGMYNSGAPLFAAEWSADQMFPRNVVGRNTLTSFLYEPSYSAQNGFGRSNESPQEIWKRAYITIESANWVIEKVPNTPMDAVRRDNIVGEAYFMRAFCHWMLTKNFGSIVVKITATNSIDNATVGKSTIDEGYAQIFADCVKAEQLLPDYTASLVKGRVTKQAAYLLHAKAALYNSKWDVALASAKAVISSNKYALVPSVADLFTAAKKDLARQEVMFAVELNATTNPIRQSQIHYFCAPNGVSNYNKGGAGAMYVYSSFYNSYSNADKRKALLDTNYINGSNVTVTRVNIDTRLATKDLVLMGKYKDPNAVGAYGNNNIYILRLADAFLIAAEAQARLGAPATESYSYMDSVRIRAGLPILTRGLSQTAFIDSVLQERSWEFIGEGDRWYDLTRTNKFLTVIPTAVNADYPTRVVAAKNKYFPIPQVEINANPLLTQNDDWK
ncbi:RagB/SusD family nutrient uptake outer membrane protein [Ferruginibacter sp.]